MILHTAIAGSPRLGSLAGTIEEIRRYQQGVDYVGPTPECWHGMTRSAAQMKRITRNVCEKSAHRHGPSRPSEKLDADSLHLAAAIESRCNRFLTNDTRPGDPEIPIEC